MPDMMSEEFRQVAEDLVEMAPATIDDAVAMLMRSFEGEPPPLSAVRRLPWYLRLLFRWGPRRWFQRWVLDHLGDELTAQPALSTEDVDPQHTL